MKRKYPISFFLIGILLNFIKYGIVLAAALLFIIIGLMRGGFCKILGFSLLAVYFTVCIVSQLYVMSVCRKESDSDDFNYFMNRVFGVEEDVTEEDVHYD